MDADFRVGDAVKVSRASHPGLPPYICDKTGVVERVDGSDTGPIGQLGGFRRWLYCVRFLLTEVWADYSGSATDTVDVSIYQDCLQRV